MPQLLSLLEEARRSEGRTTLAQLLVSRGLVTKVEAEGWVATLAGPTPPVPGRSWKASDEVAGLRLERKLGQGGMGAVYLARDTATGAQYALKTLPAAADPEERVRFEREAQAQAAVDAHPNVVRIHRSGVVGGQAFLVMELATGGDLSARLEGGPLPPREAAALVRDLARGLAHVHAQGVLHRDLKPANVVFDERGVPKLTDFGLARCEGAETLTQSGTVLGTPAYMAPEQVEARRNTITTAADVYGLGAILYDCLAQRAPFAGSLYEVLLAVLEKPPVAPSTLRDEVPPALEAICLRALAKAPAERQPSAAHLAEELELYLAGETPGPQRGGLFLGLGAVLAVLALALAGALAGTSPPDPAVTPSGSPSDSSLAGGVVPDFAKVSGSARSAIGRGDGAGALAVIHSALASVSSPRHVKALRNLRAQARVLSGDWEGLAEELHESDRSLLALEGRRAELERELRDQGASNGWIARYKQASALASQASLGGGAPHLRRAIRGRVGELLISIALDSPRGSHEALKSLLEHELPSLIDREDPRLSLVEALVKTAWHEEFHDFKLGRLPAEEGLSPRWRRNWTVLRLMRGPGKDTDSALEALSRAAPDPRFVHGPEARPVELICLYQVVGRVADRARSWAYTSLKEGLEEGGDATEEFRLALAHQERALTLSARLLDGKRHQSERVYQMELLTCVGRLDEAEAIEWTGDKKEHLHRARLVRLECALDRGEPDLAERLLEDVRLQSVDRATLVARLRAAQGRREKAETLLERIESETAPGPARRKLHVGARSVKITRKILAGKDPRAPLRKAFAR